MFEGGGLAGGQEPSLPGAHLQPGKPGLRDKQVGLAFLHEEGFSDEERAEAAQERMENLLLDAARVQRLRAGGFCGSDYELFKAALAAYGLAVMRAWIRRGEIFNLAAHCGRPVQAGHDVRQHLAIAAGHDDCDELAVETVAVALHRFREDALVNRRWSIEGGATLNTFFVGACILAFPNVFRVWLCAEYEPRHHLRRYDLVPDDGQTSLWADTNPGTDPADTAVRNTMLASALDLATNPRIRQAVGELALTAPELSEIAKKVGMSEDALKKALSRYRKTARAARKEIAGD